MSENATETTLGHLDYEAWRDLICTMGGRFNPEGVEPKAFIGWLQPINISGLTAAALGANVPRVERTNRDVRLDGADHYIALFQIAGQSAMIHNDQAARFEVGDVVLVDAALPSTFFAGDPDRSCGSLALNLPRQSLISHLGFEPRGGVYRRGGTAAGQALLDLVRSSATEAPASTLADSYMRLAVYDLVGALFAPPDPAPSRHAEKLLRRVQALITDSFADPDFGPFEAAERAGISLRYLQKLFTQHGSTCSEFIYSMRLDHAARLLNRRTTLIERQPLSEIAYACGFRDYTHFVRRFRQRFGHTPGAHSAADASHWRRNSEPT